MDLKVAALHRSAVQLLDIDFPRHADRFGVGGQKKSMQLEDILTSKSNVIETAASEQEGVSCTCEYLGAQVSGHHGNPPHLSATAAESSRMPHTKRSV